MYAYTNGDFSILHVIIFLLSFFVTFFYIRIHIYLHMLTCTPILICRHGGCYGEGEIRKLAYFEVSIDPKYTAEKVSPLLFTFIFAV